MQRFLTVPEIAEQLRVSAVTVRALLRSGLLAGVRVGSQWRIPQASLERIVDAAQQRVPCWSKA